MRHVEPLRNSSTRRQLAKLGIALSLVAGSVGFHAMRANAYSLNGCNWHTTNVSYRDAYSNSTNLDQATDSWNVRAARLRFNRVFSGGDITVYSANAGNTGWVGLTHGNGTGGSPYDAPYTCTTGNTNVTRNGLLRHERPVGVRTRVRSCSRVESQQRHQHVPERWDAVHLRDVLLRSCRGWKLPRPCSPSRRHRRRRLTVLRRTCDPLRISPVISSSAILR